MKRKLSMLLAFLMTVSVCATGCGSNSNNVDGESMAKEMNNYVYKSRNLMDIGSDENADIVASKDRLFKMSYEYDYGDAEEFEEAMPKTFEEANQEEPEEHGALTEGDGEEEITGEPIDDTAFIESEDVEAKKEASGDGDEVEETEDIIMDDMPMLEAVPEDVFGDAVGTFKLKIECFDMNGTKQYEYNMEDSANASFGSLQVADDGTAYFTISKYDGNGEVDNLICLDQSGKEAWNKELGKSDNPDDYFYIIALVARDNGIAVISTSGVENIDKSGNSAGFKAKNGSMWDIGGVTVTKDGKVVGIVYGEEEPAMYEIDIDNAKVGQKIEVPFKAYSYNITDSVTHDMILYDSTGMYYYNIGDKEIQKFMDYVASDLCVSGMNKVTEIDDKSFVGRYYDEFEDKLCVEMFEKVAPETVADRKTISVGGMWIDSNVKKKVIEYNRTNQDYRIVLVDYSSQNADLEWEDIVKKINSDIVTGKVPDIMIINSVLDVDGYIAKGVFRELDSYIEKDPDINPEDYIANITEAIKYSGKTYYIIPGFQIRTTAVKTSKLGGKTSWNMKEFTEFADSLSENTAIFDLVTKYDFVSDCMLYNGDSFVDKSTGKVSLDTPEFMEVLKFANRLPEEIDYEKLDESYWMNYETTFREDRAAVQLTTIYDIADAYYSEQRSFGEPVTYIGFPSEDGAGSSISFDSCFAISSNTKYADEAWNFIKQFIMDDYQNSIDYVLPVKKTAMDAKMKKAMEPLTYENEKGEIVEENMSVWIGDKEIKINPPTQADVDKIYALITSTTKTSNNSEAIIKIIKEEAEPYFKGQKSVEEVTKVIQSRVQVYVNENR